MNLTKVLTKDREKIPRSEAPMVVNRKETLPLIYGDTPSFLGSKVVDPDEIESDFDVIFAGVPWEGTLTWGSYSGCEIAPAEIRTAAARYGGFLPEYEIDLFDYLRIGDIGDVSIKKNDPAETMQNIYRSMDKIYKKNVIPFILGGDHSISSAVINALSENVHGNIGVIHFDAHFDNNKSFGEDEYPRCGPIYRISQNPKVKNSSIVHIAIRGPRNSPAQSAYAKEIGATTFFMHEIRRRGMESIIDEAIKIASDGTECIYVTICSDCIDAGYNPGGPPDFDGLKPHELFLALHKLGETGIAGLDYVEVYPYQDRYARSSHLASWAIIHALNGLAANKKAVKDSQEKDI